MLYLLAKAPFDAHLTGYIDSKWDDAMKIASTLVLLLPGHAVVVYILSYQQSSYEMIHIYIIFMRWKKKKWIPEALKLIVVSEQ